MLRISKGINDFIAEDSRILKDPAPFMGLSELADSSVNFTRVWVDGRLLGSFFDMNESIHRFGDYKLNIPFPQMDVHVQSNNNRTYIP
jgi:small conductance mechanosensitive channel